MPVKKETQSEPVQTYEGLHNSKQTFHAVGMFEVINGTVVLRTPDELKRINPRKYRDKIYKVDEAVDRYISMGAAVIKMKRYGVDGMSELQEILDDYGAKIIEAIRQLEKDNRPVSPKVRKFEESFKLWTGARQRGVSVLPG